MRQTALVSGLLLALGLNLCILVILLVEEKPASMQEEIREIAMLLEVNGIFDCLVVLNDTTAGEVADVAFRPGAEPLAHVEPTAATGMKEGESALGLLFPEKGVYMVYPSELCASTVDFALPH